MKTKKDKMPETLMDWARVQAKRKGISLSKALSEVEQLMPALRHGVDSSSQPGVTSFNRGDIVILNNETPMRAAYRIAEERGWILGRALDELMERYPQLKNADNRFGPACDPRAVPRNEHPGRGVMK